MCSDWLDCGHSCVTNGKSSVELAVVIRVLALRHSPNITVLRRRLDNTNSEKLIKSNYVAVCRAAAAQGIIQKLSCN